MIWIELLELESYSIFIIRFKKNPSDRWQIKCLICVNSSVKRDNMPIVIIIQLCVSWLCTTLCEDELNCYFTGWIDNTWRWWHLVNSKSHHFYSSRGYRQLHKGANSVDQQHCKKKNNLKQTLCDSIRPARLSRPKSSFKENTYVELWHFTSYDDIL